MKEIYHVKKNDTVLTNSHRLYSVCNQGDNVNCNFTMNPWKLYMDHISNQFFCIIIHNLIHVAMGKSCMVAKRHSYGVIWTEYLGLHISLWCASFTPIGGWMRHITWAIVFWNCEGLNFVFHYHTNWHTTLSVYKESYWMTSILLPFVYAQFQTKWKIKWIKSRRNKALERKGDTQGRRNSLRVSWSRP